MDSKRFILITAFVVVLMLLYQAWQQDYGVVASSAPPATSEGAIPDENITDRQSPADVPTQAVPDRKPAQDGPALPDNSRNMESITVNTDSYRLQIGLRGAGIIKAELWHYPVSVDQQDTPFVLMDRSVDLVFITQGGLLGSPGSPNHDSMFTADRENYSMAAGNDILEVPLFWSSDYGLRVRKVYRFQRGSHLFSIRYEIENRGTRSWKGQSYLQLKRNDPGRKSMFGGSYTYTGAVLSSPDERYEKISFSDIKDQQLNTEIVNGWVAMIQHYFVSALIPSDKNATHHFYTMAQADGNYAIGVITPETTVTPGATVQIEEQMYVGPKIQEDLEVIADGLELTVDYGVLWFISKPLFWCLGKFHDLVNNWGWSIILLTFLLKLLFYPLSAAGYRSMAKMRQVQPRLMSLRERYKDDKMRLNQAMMKLYKEEKINPFGGCLPILIQIPVFLALYFVLLESVELRQAEFMFWLTDLSEKDPYYVLPVVMGITMFIQQKLNPAPMDPVQAKVMSVLPIVFTVLFAFFQSGLVLYWVVSNILSILQQWMITRNLEKSGLKSKT